MNLLALGAVGYDKIHSPFGNTSKILGGPGSYICLSSALFNVKVNLLSIVGGDFKKEFISLFKDKGVNTDWLEIIENGKTFYWEGKYRNNINFRDTIKVELGVTKDYNPSICDNLKKSDILLLGNSDPRLQYNIIKQFKKRPKLIVLDSINYWITHLWDEFKKVIKHVDVLCINEEEARLVTKEYSLLKVAKNIIDMGPTIVIIKKGENGALLFNKNDYFFVPSFLLENAIDPTGAGDTFIGSFCGYLGETLDFSFENMKIACVYASVVASFTCQVFGIEGIINLTRADISRRIVKFVSSYKLNKDFILLS